MNKYYKQRAVWYESITYSSEGGSSCKLIRPTLLFFMVKLSHIIILLTYNSLILNFIYIIISNIENWVIFNNNTILNIQAYLTKDLQFFIISFKFFISTLKGKNNSHNYIIKNNKNYEIEHNNKYTKYEILDPLNNRHIIAKVAKNKKGVYIFEILGCNTYYVGSSVNLYNRVCSYFMPSILSKADRYVLRYFMKNGFNNIKLIMYIFNDSSSIFIEEVLDLEKYFIDKLSIHNLLNIEKIPRSGVHLPMSEYARNKLRKMRGQLFYVYDSLSKSLLFIFESKQFAYDNIHIDHRTLNNCILYRKLYLDRFLFSIKPILDYRIETRLTLEQLKVLVLEEKNKYKYKQLRSKTIYVENIFNSDLNKQFNSIGEFARYVKGDRGTIRNYVNGTKSGLYKGQWKITLVLK